MATRTPHVLDWVDRQLGRLAGLFAFAGSLAIFGLLVVTVIAVLWRYGFNNPIYGIEDTSIVVLTIVAAASVCYGARHGSHVSVNVMSYFFGRHGRAVTRFTDVAMRTLTVAILALATYSLFIKACGAEKACITGNLSISHRPFYYVLGVSIGLYTAHVLVQLLTSLFHFSGEDPNAIED